MCAFCIILLKQIVNFDLIFCHLDMVTNKTIIYPRNSRRKNDVGIEAVLAFAEKYSQKMVNASTVPGGWREAPLQMTAALGKVGYRLVTHTERPDLLRRDQLLLWPLDEVIPKYLRPITKSSASVYNPNDGRMFVPTRALEKNEIENKLFQGDCSEVLTYFPERSVDLILCDLPYGTTQNKWDSVIPMDRLWSLYKRILKPKGVVVLTSHGIFTAKLIISNEPWFKYKIVWTKSKPTNFLNAKKQPLRKHEDICVFYAQQPVYHPQMAMGAPYDKGVRKNQFSGSYGDFLPARVQSDGERYPTDVVYFKTAESEGAVWHPTQKPVELGRYLVKTYTDPGALVLDNAFGSGSFLVAAALEGRRYVGIEKNENVSLFKGDSIDYVGLARERLNAATFEEGNFSKLSNKRIVL